MTVYIISQHETSDSINFGVDFRPEAYRDLEKAENRLKELKEDLGEWSGLYYTLESTEIL
jgi:predicted translin family RNA/ssDNA-binding protein